MKQMSGHRPLSKIFHWLEASLNVSVAQSSKCEVRSQGTYTGYDELVRRCGGGLSTVDVFLLFYSRNFGCCGRLNPYEKLRQNFLFDSHGDDLRDCVCGRSASLQEERQKLPDE
jgi:hypothetical protein